MVPISLPGYTQPIDSRVLAATIEPALASEFPFQRDMNTGNTVRFIKITLSRPFLLTLVSGNRSVLAGHQAPSATAGAAVQPPPTSDRITSTARTCTSCFTPTPRSFLRQPVSAPQFLPSTESSLEPDPLVSQRHHNRMCPFVHRG